jgi:hypothetical protein
LYFSDDEPIPATIAVASLMDVTEEDVAGLLGFELGNSQLTQFLLTWFPLTWFFSFELVTKAEPYAQRLIAEEEVKAKHSLLGALVFSGTYLKATKNG